MTTKLDLDDRAYDRGRRDARLDNHDSTFRRLEVALDLSYVLTALGLGLLTLITQRLGDKLIASAATAVALAEALKIEKDTARETLALETSKTTTKWGRSQTLIAAAALVVSFLGFLYITNPR